MRRYPIRPHEIAELSPSSAPAVISFDQQAMIEAAGQLKSMVFEPPFDPEASLGPELNVTINGEVCRVRIASYSVGSYGLFTAVVLEQITGDGVIIVDLVPPKCRFIDDVQQHGTFVPRQVLWGINVFLSLESCFVFDPIRALEERNAREQR